LLQLLIVPLALAAIGFWFTAQQEARQREVEDRRAQVEQEIEAERAEQVTLQAYFDQMGTLLLDRNLRAADENSDVRRLARARTLVVLDALGPTRQERVLRFLHEAELIRATPPDEQPVIPLKYASLENIELPHRILLRGADLQQAYLSGANLAHIDLRDTYLAGAHFEGTDLEGAHLQGADLSGTFSEGADLSDANLADVDLSNAEELWKGGTDMRERGAGLGHADLSGANLKGANLKGANLKGANVTDEQLAECKSLEGATMPDGARHP
jgi:Pentapeptide repeats (8 copies)